MPLTPRRAAAEAAQTVRSAPVVACALVAIVACMAAAILLSAGRAAALERDVLTSVDEAGTRTIVVSSNRSDGGLDPSVVDRIAGLSGVESAIGFGVARDVTNANIPGGEPAASRAIYGEWIAGLQTVRGAPRPGAAMVSRTSGSTLGLADGVGSVLLDGDLVPVVGEFAATGVLAPLDGFVLITPDPAREPDPVTLVYVVAETASAVPQVAEAILEVTGEQDLETIGITTSDRLVQLQQVVSGQLGGFARQLALGILCVGMALITLCMVMLSNSKRRDFGRRRALGASRQALLAVVALTSLILSLCGVVVGVAVAIATLVWQQHPLPPTNFVVAGSILMILVAVLGSLPGAFLAAWRDPATVLRVP